MPDAPVQAQIYVIACYLVDCIKRDTILGMFIKHRTLQN